MKPNHRAGHKIVSRRDTLKVCLLPAGMFAARVLTACADKTGDATGASNAVQAGMSGAGTQAAGMGAGGQAPAGAAGNTSQTTAGARALAGSGQTSAGSGGAAAPISGAGGDSPRMGADAGTSTVADAGMDPVAGPDVPWATGGTGSLSDAYPDPFMDASNGMACKLYPAQTIGPCYADSPAMRSDISEGLDGLPMRVSLRVVKGTACMPVPDASVDIWHSGSQGIYSAFAMGTICNPGSENVANEMFCRGVQVTDADGRVEFDTVFPGWYTGRSIHVHFTVRVGNQEYVTSQLYFEDALSDEIVAQGVYAARGMRDTTNSTDFLFGSGGGSPAEVIFETVKRPGGVLHAWKLLTIS